MFSLQREKRISEEGGPIQDQQFYQDKSPQWGNQREVIKGAFQYGEREGNALPLGRTKEAEEQKK